MLLLGVLLNRVGLVTDCFGLLGSFSKLSVLSLELAFVEWVPSDESSKFLWLLFSVIRSEFSLLIWCSIVFFGNLRVVLKLAAALLTGCVVLPLLRSFWLLLRMTGLIYLMRKEKS